MSDRGDEKTVEKPPEKSTEDLLAETDKLLSDLEGGESGGGGDGDGGGRKRQKRDRRASSEEANMDLDLGLDDEPAPKQQAGSTSDEGLTRYFNPKSFLLVSVLMTVGFIAAGFTPLLGGVASFVGMVAAAFVYGLATSRKRYAETALGGLGVGLGTALLSNFRFAFLPGGEYLLAFGAGLGLVGALVGYYFGSDLRNGLTSDPDDFEDDLSW
ncbi:hypothetical protein [Haloarchaeobius sp. HME9146]|uniref:hypothetical protein n=1 Tax=Haloarchaeobius sp. HME9146 TaxID=2978732 RepID=UPI0021C120AA|nr:hypothetical protein [Haloarchaeobius sp. HME9146]MCT9097744.1 hypothetical protein [Haloarchaeobius sp. HME9146]